MVLEGLIPQLTWWDFARLILSDGDKTVLYQSNTYPADHDYGHFQSVSLVDLISVNGN